MHDRTGWHRAWRLTKAGLLLFIILLVVAAAAIWIWRKPLADDFIKDELERRGVQGSYTLDRVGHTGAGEVERDVNAYGRCEKDGRPRSAAARLSPRA